MQPPQPKDRASGSLADRLNDDCANAVAAPAASPSMERMLRYVRLRKLQGARRGLFETFFSEVHSSLRRERPPSSPFTFEPGLPRRLSLHRCVGSSRP